jgi:hypothetical protein
MEPRITTESLGAGTTASAGSERSVDSSADLAAISGPGQLFAALQKLATENRDQFKTVTAAEVAGSPLRIPA